MDSRLNNAGMTDTEGRSVIPEVCSQESRGGGTGGFPPASCGNDMLNTGITQTAKQLE